MTPTSRIAKIRDLLRSIAASAEEMQQESDAALAKAFASDTELRELEKIDHNLDASNDAVMN